MSHATFLDRVHAQARALLAKDIVARIWDRDPTVWPTGGSPQVEASIVNRLGWLTVPREMPPHVPALEHFSETVRASGLRRACLLGMGGSSLCAEVFRQVYGVAPDHLDLQVLDTTDEETIRSASAALDPERTLFIVSSKSGTTIEVVSLERYFAARMSGALPESTAGSHFVAITDPGTPLAELAAARAYRHTFYGRPDVGGRFSALSGFGLVPAGLIGANAKDLLAGGEAMADGCAQANLTNPGLELGCALGIAAVEGRDKLTLLIPESLASLALWVEQLVAESTGKDGKGLLPIVDEPRTDAARYGNDRLFVALETEDEQIDRHFLASLEQLGHPVYRVRTRRSGVGAEVFRWEFGVAVAGSILGVNPFDEPNVQEAKNRTRELLRRYEATGRLTDEPSTAALGPVTAFGGDRFKGSSPAQVVRQAVDSARPGDYIAFLSYLPPDPPSDASLQEARRRVLARKGVATTVGIGPRYLHSTGQYHKGGPDRGIAILITADDVAETPIPAMAYSFSVLKRAQALGDLEALRAHGRRVVRIHFGLGDYVRETALRDLFADALE